MFALFLSTTILLVTDNTVITRDSPRRTGDERKNGRTEERKVESVETLWLLRYIRRGERTEAEVNEAIWLLTRRIPAGKHCSRRRWKRYHNNTERHGGKGKGNKGGGGGVGGGGGGETVHGRRHLLTTTGFESRLSRIAYCSLDRASPFPPPPLSIDDRSADLPRHTMFPRESLPLRTTVGTSYLPPPPTTTRLLAFHARPEKTRLRRFFPIHVHIHIYSILLTASFQSPLFYRSIRKCKSPFFSPRVAWHVRVSIRNIVVLTLLRDIVA